MELTTNNILSLFDTNREQRASFVTQVIDSIQDGTADPLKVHLQVKAMEEIIKAITGSETYKEMLLNEAAKYGKSFEHFNANFQIKETGTKYDYSQCNDSFLSQQKYKLEKLQTVIKDRENLLKNIPSEGIEMITPDGEVETVYPPSKTSTTSVTVNLK